MSIRLTFSEYDALIALAKRTKKNLSAVARDKLFTPNCFAELVEQNLRFREQQIELQTILHLIRDLISTEEIALKNTQTIKHIQCFLEEHDRQSYTKR